MWSKDVVPRHTITPCSVVLRSVASDPSTNIKDPLKLDQVS
jgi:hypothetical protein